jgi:hypothetical protein
MQLNVTDEQLKAVVSEAIYKTLDESTRERLIKEAIAYLMRPEKNIYSSKVESPLERIFKDAMNSVAAAIAHKEITENELIQSEIKTLISEAYMSKLKDQEGRNSISRKFEKAFENIFDN